MKTATYPRQRTRYPVPLVGMDDLTVAIHAFIDDAPSPVDLGDLMLPARGSHTFVDGPWIVTLDWELHGQEPRCTRVSVERQDGGSVGYDEPGFWPLREWTLNAAARAVTLVPLGGTIGTDAIAVPAGVALARERLGGAYERVTDERLARVAAIYRAAHAAGLRPTREVAQRLGCSRAWASRLVMRARTVGMLGAARPGAAGEL